MATPSGLRKRWELDLSEVITLAQSDAPTVLIAQTRLSNRYWRYQSFLADYKPQIDLEATLPNLNRSIDRITIPDGTDIFVQRSLISNSLGLRFKSEHHCYWGANLRFF